MYIHKYVIEAYNNNNCKFPFFLDTQFKIFRKEFHLPSPFAKTGYLFWPDFLEVRFFVYQGLGFEPEGLIKITNGFWRMEVFGLAVNSN